MHVKCKSQCRLSIYKVDIKSRETVSVWYSILGLLLNFSSFFLLIVSWIVNPVYLRTGFQIRFRFTINYFFHRSFKSLQLSIIFGFGRGVCIRAWCRSLWEQWCWSSAAAGAWTRQVQVLWSKFLWCCGWERQSSVEKDWEIPSLGQK